DEALASAATTMGIPLRALTGVRLQLDQFNELYPPIPDDSARDKALLNRADVLGALAEYEASQAALQLEIANQYPDITLGPGYTYDMGAHKYLLGLSGIALTLFNRNEGPIAEATARRGEAAAHVTAVQAQAVGEADQAAQNYRAALVTLRGA